MYYTDYKMKEIFTNRQSAIESSRRKAKDEFFESLVGAHLIYDEHTDVEASIYRRVSDYQAIKEVFEAYQKNRSIVYDVKIDLLGIF